MGLGQGGKRERRSERGAGSNVSDRHIRLRGGTDTHLLRSSRISTKSAVSNEKIEPEPSSGARSTGGAAVEGVDIGGMRVSR